MQHAVHIYGLSEAQRVQYKGKIVVYKPGKSSEIVHISPSLKEYKVWIKTNKDYNRENIRMEYLSPNAQNICFYN